MDIEVPSVTSVGTQRLDLLSRDLLDAEFPENPDIENANLRLIVAALNRHALSLERELARLKRDFNSPAITDDGYDSHPALDYVARRICPSHREGLSDREMAAQHMLKAANHPEVYGTYASLLFWRLASAMMGNKYCGTVMVDRPRPRGFWAWIKSIWCSIRPWGETK